jgi:hypothetical protein
MEVSVGPDYWTAFYKYILAPESYIREDYLNNMY